MTAALNLDDDESQFVMILPSKEEDKPHEGRELLYYLENQKLHFEDGSYVLRHLLAGVRTRL